MPLHYRASITRRDLWNVPATLFVFGDNLARHGFGGQASECRGEVNAVGVPTKRYPGRAPRDYFTDADYGTWHREAMPALSQLAEHLRSGGDVVWPAAGIGTGLAELSSRAPRIWSCLERARERLDVLGATYTPPTPKVISPTSHPLVRAVLAAFPGAQIVGVRDRTALPASRPGEGRAFIGFGAAHKGKTVGSKQKCGNRRIQLAPYAVSAYTLVVRRWSPDTTEEREMVTISVTLRWKAWRLIIAITF